MHVAELPRFAEGPETVAIQMLPSRRDALLPYGYRTLPALRARELSGLGMELIEWDRPTWPGRKSIFASKPTYGWPLGTDPIATDAIWWGKALVAGLATFAGLYLISRI